MNWVGGARSRIKMRDEMTKQKEYFEKKRYQNKVRRLEKPTSPRKRKLPLSTDLLSLQAASFSAKKFSTTDSSSPISQKKVTKVDLDQSRSSLLPFRKLDDVELPMSPGAPSKLLLQEANSGVSEESVSRSQTHEPPSSFLMTQKHLFENPQLFQLSDTGLQQPIAQMSSRLATTQEICPEKFESSHNTRSSISRIKPQIEKRLMFTPCDYSASQQHSFITKTSDCGDQLPNKLLQTKASENLFFEFLPQAMSTLKRPLQMDEESTGTKALERSYNESPMSHKSDTSYVSSYQSTLSQDEELLVPQGFSTSPATTASSPCWEAASISSYENVSSDNTDNKDVSMIRTENRDRGYGSRSTTSGGEDTPHQSDSSLTTFRQYYRKKLKKHAKPPAHHTSSISRTMHVTTTPNRHLQHQERIDLNCHEVISPILPVNVGDTSAAHHLFKEHSENTLIHVNKSIDADVHVISNCEGNFIQNSDYSPERCYASTQSSDICQARGSIDGANKTKKLIPDTNLADAITNVNAILTRGSQRNGLQINKMGNQMATEWESFLGGGTELKQETVDSEEKKLMTASQQFDDASSEGSCAADGNIMNITSQVLFEVLKLDKEINKGISDTTMNEYNMQNKGLEAFDSETCHQLQSRWTAEDILKKDTPYNTNDSKKHVNVATTGSESLDTRKPEEDLNTNIDAQTKMSSDARKGSSHSFSNVEHDMLESKHTQDPNESIVQSNVKVLMESDQEHLSNSSSLILKNNCISEVCHEADQHLEKIQNNDGHVASINNQNQEVLSPMSRYNNIAIQCSTMHVDVGIQCGSDESHPKNLLDNGVQCDMCQSITKTTKQTHTPDGGRINGREQRAYGPTDAADICCVS